MDSLMEWEKTGPQTSEWLATGSTPTARLPSVQIMSMTHSGEGVGHLDVSVILECNDLYIGGE